MWTQGNNDKQQMNETGENLMQRNGSVVHSKNKCDHKHAINSRILFLKRILVIIDGAVSQI